MSVFPFSQTCRKDLLDPRTPSSRRFGRSQDGNTRIRLSAIDLLGKPLALACNLHIRAKLHTHHDVSGPKLSKGCAVRSH
eukprot:2776055-Prymnesium_polylepis.2